MLFWDVNNGIARRAWGTNDNAVRARFRFLRFEHFKRSG
jgi:hypothetical protein